MFSLQLVTTEYKNCICNICHLHGICDYILSLTSFSVKYIYICIKQFLIPKAPLVFKIASYDFRSCYYYIDMWTWSIYVHIWFLIYFIGIVSSWLWLLFGLSTFPLKHLLILLWFLLFSTIYMCFFSSKLFFAWTSWFAICRLNFLNIIHVSNN